MPGTERFARQVALFGEEGQARLRETRAAIVGLGGLGSHVAQQLAYLGVGDLLLVDADVVTESNLNRLIGTTPEDIGRPKVEVAREMIEAIAPEATVRCEQVSVQELSEELLADRTVLFGCVDNDDPRLDLLERTSSLALAYIDAATDVLPDEDRLRYGGQVVVSTGSGCLLCRDLLDQEEIRRARMSDSDRDAERRIYGIERADLGVGGGPAVVTLNGVVASLATTEFLVSVTGLREPRPHLVYKGWLGTVHASSDPPAPGCYYCAGWAGQAPKAPKPPGTSIG